PRAFIVDAGDGAMQIAGARVTASFFDTLGALPARGRAFTAADDLDSAAPAAIVSDAFWRVRLAAEPDIVGRSMRFDGRGTSIVGVLPRDFRFRFTDQEPQVYLPAVSTAGEITAPQVRTGAGFLTYLARLEASASPERARAYLAAFDERYRREHGSF